MGGELGAFGLHSCTMFCRISLCVHTRFTKPQKRAVTLSSITGQQLLTRIVTKNAPNGQHADGLH